MLGLALATWVRPARAGNDDEVIVGNEAAMTGGAITATSRTGSSLYYNPAGLVNVEASSVDASASAYGLRLYRADGLLQFGDGRRGDGQVTEIVLVPSAVSYVRPLSDSVRGGIGVFVNRWSDFDIRARILEGSPEALLTVASRYQKADAIGGVGIRVTDDLRLGFTLHAIYTTVEQSTQIGGGSDVSSFTVSSLAESTGVGLRLGAGLQWDVVAGLVLGVGLATPSARIFSRYVEDALVSVDTPSTRLFDADGVEEQSFGWEWEHPFRARLGLAYQFDEDSWISLDGDVLTPLANADLQVDRRIDFNLRLGGIVGITPSWALGAGIFTDRSGETSPLASDFYGGTLGVRYRNERALDPDKEEEDRLVFETTVALRYAYGSGSASTLIIDVDDAGEIYLSDGVTSFIAHEIGLHVGGALRF